MKITSEFVSKKFFELKSEWAASPTDSNDERFDESPNELSSFKTFLQLSINNFFEAI